MVRRRRNETAAEQHNRQMGGRGPRWTSPLETYQPPSNYYRRSAQRAGDVLSGSSMVKPAATRAARRSAGLGTGAGGSGGGSNRAATAYENVYNQLAERYVESTAEQQAIQEASAEQNEDTERPWWGDTLNFVGGGLGLIDDGTGFGGSFLGRALDVFSRGLYTTAGALENAASQETHTGFSPEDIAYTLGNMATGAVRGFTGTEKHGAGDVYEAFKNNPTNSLGEPFRMLERTAPNTEQNLSRIIGGAGEYYLDPLRVIHPSLPQTIRGGANKGRIATEDILRETVAESGSRAAADVIANPALADANHLWNVAPNTLVDRLRGAVIDDFDQAVVNVRGGGRRGVKLMNPRKWPTAVANAVRDEARVALGEGLRNDIDSLWKFTFGSTVRGRRAFSGYVQRLINKSDNFREFWTGLEKDLLNAGKLKPGYSVDDILDEIATGSVTRKMLDDLGDVAISRYDVELDGIFENALRDAHNPAQRNLGIRVGNRDIPVRLTGRAFSRLGTGIDKVMPNLSDILDRTIFERHFPGIFSGKVTKYRAQGFRDFETVRDEIREMARKYSRDETRELSRLLRTGGMPSSARMQTGLDFIKQKYLEIFGEEFNLGARAEGDIHQQFYEYIHLKGGSRENRIKFNRERSKAWKAQNNPGQWTIDTAKDMGLKPQENAFENLTLRYAASRRNIVQALFRNDLVENWASNINKLDSQFMSKWKLHKLELGEVPMSYRQMMKKNGQDFYISESIWSMAKKFEKISNWNTNEWVGFARGAVKVINLIKAAVTLPYFGFHFKNMIGDIFMGLLDDVNPNDYARVMDRYTRDLAGQTAMYRIVPGQLEFSHDEVVRFFLEDADAGFFHVDSGLQQTATAGSIPRRIGRHVTSTLAEASDIRERIGRFVHYETAFEQEAKGLWDNGMRNVDTIERRAREAALTRVNGYKFDYNALMPWEQNLKSLAFPFYTYMRKAAPLLMEQMFFNPHYFSMINRFMEYNDGTGADDFNYMNMPSWIRNIGFAEVNHGEGEPWALTADVLPLASLELLTGSHDIQGLSGNILQNLNPLLKAPIELWAGQNTYTGQPTGGGWEYLMQNLPLIGDISQLVNDPPNSGQDFLTRRLTGLGLPFHHVTYQQQEQQQNANRDRLIDDPIKRFNYSSDVVHVSVTSDMKYRVTYTANPDQPIAVFSTPQAAINFARSLPNAGFQQGYVDPYHPPTMQDVNTAMAGR